VQEPRCEQPCPCHVPRIVACVVCFATPHVSAAAAGVTRILEAGLQPLFPGPEQLFIEVIDQAGAANPAQELTPPCHLHIYTMNQCLDQVVDAWGWLGASGVTLHGCFGNRLGRATPHAVSWKVRSALSASELAAVQDDVGPYANARDVVAFVKEYMGSTGLLQAPVLVLPANRANKVRRTPDTAAARRPYSEDRLKELQSLASACEADLGLQRAADYLRRLACSDQAGGRPVNHDWLAGMAVAPPPPTEPTGNECFPHLPPPAWQLQVKFRAV